MVDKYASMETMKEKENKWEEQLENRERSDNLCVTGLLEESESSDMRDFKKKCIMESFDKGDLSPHFAVDRAHRLSGC